jgi:DNA-binding MarR family transcriptional regulator
MGLKPGHDPSVQHTPELEAAILLYGRVLAIVEPIRLRYLSELGLTLAQLRVLGTLAEQPGLSLRDLAFTLSVTPSTVSQQVDRLVRHGFVTRHEDTADRRLLHHALTEQGVQAIEQVRRAARERLRSVFAQLSPQELADLIRSFSRVCEAAAAAAGAACSDCPGEPPAS